jgi:hypothetical protein
VEQDAPIYVPGDQITLDIEIEHVQNFTKVYADFMRRPEREDEGPLSAAIPSRRIYLQDRNDDGSKISEVELEAIADRHTFEPGVYELRRVRGVTVMAQTVEFDVDERLKELRFRYAPEPRNLVPKARPLSPPSEGV